MICFHGKPFDSKVVQVYASTTNAEEAEIKQFYENLQDLLELTPNKSMSFSSQWVWNAKVGCQEIPGVTGKFGLKRKKRNSAKVSRVLPREYTGYSKHSLPKRQKMTLHMEKARWAFLKSD